MVTDLQALASTATGYYTDNHSLPSNMPMNYGQQSQQGSQGGYYAPTAQSGPGVYGQVYYQDPGSHAAFSTGKQGFNALNNLVPDIHNGSFDPRSYAQVSSRLNVIRSSGIPFLRAGGMADYQPVAAATSNEGANGVFGPTTHYSLPALLPNLRTKNDLHAADSRYAQMQTTIYENSNQLAAAGVAQPEMHYVQNGIVFRHSQSPPSRQLLSPQNGPSSIAIPAANSPPNHHGTPGLTPPSSASTYSSGHSPVSNYNPSPIQTSSTMYPNLPSSAAASNSYFPSSMAPSSALGTQFDTDSRHRHGGGTLQKARPLQRVKVEEAMDTSDDSCTTPAKAVSSPKENTKPSVATRDQVGVPSSNIDPALSGLVSSPGGSGELDEGAIRANEIWVEQARTIEALRKWVQGRLEREEFEDDDGPEGSEEGGMQIKMEREQGQGQNEVFYPALSV